MAGLRNWARNTAYRARKVYYPKSVAEVEGFVSGNDRVRARGSGHSFNDVADTTGALISLAEMNRVVELDLTPGNPTVTVDGGARYGELCAFLDREGYALHNLASLPHISVAGACATGTHGSGDKNGNVATAVAGLEIVTADGKRKTFDSAHEHFPAVVVGLGGFGVVTRITLRIEPAFDMTQQVYENLPFRELEAHFDEITAAAYSVSLFTDWQTDGVDQVWLKRKVTDRDDLTFPSRFRGATRANGKRHPVAGVPARNCTEQRGVPGPWHERLPHFRLMFTPSVGDELHSEYFVHRDRAVAALRAVAGLRHRLAGRLWISEIRTVAPDGLWMSPAYERPCVAIHFTWKSDGPAVAAVLPTVEGTLAEFDARPHWGKLFGMGKDRLKGLYPKLPDFADLLLHYDGAGKFHNDFLERCILPRQAG